MHLLTLIAALAAAPPDAAPTFDLGGGKVGTAWALAFSPDGTRLAVARGDGVVLLLDAEGGKIVHRLTGHKPRPDHLAFSPDGRLLASAEARTVRLWDASAGKPLRELTGHTSDVVAIAFTSDGKGLVTAGWSDGVFHWPVAGGEREALHKAAEKRGRPVALTAARGGRVAVMYRSMAVKELPLSGEPPAGVRELGPPADELPIAFASPTLPDRGLLLPGGRGAVAVATMAGGGRIWPRGKREDGRELMAGEGESVWALAASPSGRVLALGTDRGRVVVVETGTGQHLFARRVWGEVKALAFSPCGRRIAVGFWDAPGVRVLDIDAGTPARSGEELEARWAELSSDDPAAAWRAMGALAKSGRVAAFLTGKLRASDAVYVERLAADLGSEDFKRREAAAKELERLGLAAEPALRRLTAKGADLEAARRAARLLRPMDVPEAWVRRGRVLDLLERLATEEARGLLRHLASGPEGWWMTVEAGEALERVGRRR